MFASNEIWQKSDPLDRLTAFEGFVKNLDKEEYLLKKDQRQRSERKHREAFRDLIKEILAPPRKFNHRSPWCEVAAAIKSDPRYLDLVG